MPSIGTVREFNGYQYVCVELYPPVRQWVELEEWNNRGWAREVLNRASEPASDVFDAKMP